MLRILKKHVVLIMDDGVKLKGFIDAARGGHFDLIETDNSLTIVKQEAIAYAKIRNNDLDNMDDVCQHPEKDCTGDQKKDRIDDCVREGNDPYEEPTLQYRKVNEDFSIPLDAGADNETYVRQAQFVRETSRKEE